MWDKNMAQSYIGHEIGNILMHKEEMFKNHVSK